MSTSNLIPYLGLIAVILAAGIGYFANVELERRKTWAFQERTKAYSGFIEAAGAIAMIQKAKRSLYSQLDDEDAAQFREQVREAIFATDAREMEKSGDFLAAKMRIAVFGTNEVVGSVAAFFRGGAALNTPDDWSRFIDIVMVIRKQTVGGRASSRDDISALMFGY